MKNDPSEVSLSALVRAYWPAIVAASGRVRLTVIAQKIADMAPDGNWSVETVTRTIRRLRRAGVRTESSDEEAAILAAVGLDLQAPPPLPLGIMTQPTPGTPLAPHPPLAHSADRAYTTSAPAATGETTPPRGVTPSSLNDRASKYLD
jgi:hypothetical protein